MIVSVICCVTGQKGTAYTLVTPKDREFAGHLVRNLEGANQFVPPELIDLAMQARSVYLRTTPVIIIIIYEVIYCQNPLKITCSW